MRCVENSMELCWLCTDNFQANNWILIKLSRNNSALSLTFNYKSIKLVLQWFVYLSLVMILCLIFSPIFLLFLLFSILGASFELSVLIAYFVTSDEYNVQQKKYCLELGIKIQSKSSACSLLISFSKQFFSALPTEDLGKRTHTRLSLHVLRTVRETEKLTLRYIC